MNLARVLGSSKTRMASSRPVLKTRIRYAVAVRLLVIEDDQKLSDYLADRLRAEGYSVEFQARGADGLARILTGDFAVAILDLSLPDLDGIPLIKAVRAAHNTTPILVLTARTTVGDRVVGLDAGADDYLAKPFSFAELTARLRALTRRPHGSEHSNSSLQYADLALDLLTRRATRGGVELDLNPKEFSLLACLILNAERVLGRATLLETVWGYKFDPQTNVVEKLVSRLRKKIDTGNEQLIHTLRGEGYVLRK